MSHSNFLVTGAHGFIGAWVVKRLLAAGENVVMFDLSADPKRLRLIMDEDEIARAAFVAGDITDPAAVTSVIERHGINRIIHLAGLMVPVCKANPRLGALVNVVGTINIFEAAIKSAGQVRRIAYASSAAVFGNSEDIVTETQDVNPTTHYGVFKRCNEDNARVFYLDNGLSSIGLRPLTVYGVGRDFGLTSDPTKAMKAAVVGRPYHIRFGGSTDFLFAADAADAFIRSAATDLEGAHVFNLHGETVSLAEVVREIEESLRAVRGPKARAQITFSDNALPFPAKLDDTAIRNALGDLPATSPADGVRATVERFAELSRQGPLDTSDLDS
ncbi:MAG TPA: SDR family oxidoreductase [Blastocatellia bacterium]|nr:SDR family oxidoreductase [Blastocatellia bacterium]